jgi:3-phosphoglycerate kinase
MAMSNKEKAARHRAKMLTDGYAARQIYVPASVTMPTVFDEVMQKFEKDDSVIVQLKVNADIGEDNV